MQPFLPAVGVSRKNRKIISLVSGKEFLTALCFQACPSIGLSKSGDIPSRRPLALSVVKDRTPKGLGRIPDSVTLCARNHMSPQ